MCALTHVDGKKKKMEIGKTLVVWRSIKKKKHADEIEAHIGRKRFLNDNQSIYSTLQSNDFDPVQVTIYLTTGSIIISHNSRNKIKPPSPSRLHIHTKMKKETHELTEQEKFLETSQSLKYK